MKRSDPIMNVNINISEFKHSNTFSFYRLTRLVNKNEVNTLGLIVDQSVDNVNDEYTTSINGIDQTADNIIVIRAHLFYFSAHTNLSFSLWLHESSRTSIALMSLSYTLQSAGSRK